MASIEHNLAGSSALSCDDGVRKRSQNPQVSIPPARETICSVIVTYHPDSRFIERVERITRQASETVIVDNGSSEQAVHQLRNAAIKLNVHLILNKENVGIARALNQGARWGQERGYAWALTVDQDSVVAEDLVETLSGLYEEFPEREKLAVIGSNHIDPLIRKPFWNFNGNSHCAWHEVKTTITSGSLISLIAYKVVGPFREELFIDCVDFEYCLRARSRGLRIIMACKPLLEHPIGAATRHRLPWRMTGTSNHSPIRRYYMTRNRLVLAREYLLKEPAWILSTLYRHIKSTILMCLFEKDLISKLGYTALGFLDGAISSFQRKIGSRNHPSRS
jgi:rhamnosyltransferase